MTLSSTKLIPELNYWFNSFLVNSTVNKAKLYVPSKLDADLFTADKSFIRLLFDDNWPSNYDSYNYLFSENTSRYSWPSAVQRRLLIYPSSSKYYECVESDGENFFNLETDDLTLLDELLAYRIDSTSADISSIVYNDLSTNLSKLIYLYLDLQINNNYTNYETETLIGESLLEICYEQYLIEKMFNYRSIQIVYQGD